MDIHQLIKEARAEGLTVEADGDQLRFRNTMHKGHLREKLLSHRADVLRVLRGEVLDDPKPPTGDERNTPRSPTDDDWEDPKPLSESLPSVDPYSPDLLPADIQDAVIDISERMQCPPDFVAAPMLVAMASVIGCQLAIRPRKYDDWTVVPNLWGFVVGRPSLKKTPAASESIRQLRKIEDRAKEKMAPEIEMAEIERRMIPEQIKVLRIKMLKELKDVGASSPEVQQLAEQIKDLEEFQPPTPRRIVTTDSTIEKLGELLNTHCAGMLLFVDELLGWMRQLERESNAGDRKKFLTLWTGFGKLNIDRIGRGETVVESPCLSIFGCCTPGGLVEYVNHAVRGGLKDDGLMQRVQVVVCPDPPTTYKEIDRHPDLDALNRLERVFEILGNLDPQAIGRRDPADPTGIPYVRFDSDAQNAFNDWYHPKQRSALNCNVSEAIESHMSKYDSLMPSIALVLHLAMGDTGPVSLKAAEMAIRWVRHLESHAKRLYSLSVASERQQAANLLDHLVHWDGRSRIRVRAIREKGWGGLSTTEAVQAALDVLVDAGWVRAVNHKPESGRPTTNYDVHPRASRFLAEYKKRTGKALVTFDDLVPGDDGLPDSERSEPDMAATDVNHGAGEVLSSVSP